MVMFVVVRCYAHENNYKYSSMHSLLFSKGLSENLDPHISRSIVISNIRSIHMCD